MALSYRHVFLLFFVIAAIESAESGMIFNRGFKLNASDDCDLYSDYCVESKGYNKTQNYNRNGRCNITVIYEGTTVVVATGPHYEVEPDEDYFLINGIKFSDYCEEFFSLEWNSTWLSKGSTIYWHTDSANEYKGWRFCLANLLNGYALQPDSSSSCKCNGVGLPESNMGGSCGDWNDQGSTTWCYADNDQCPGGYRSCHFNGDTTKYFFCNKTDSPTRSPLALTETDSPTRSPLALTETNETSDGINFFIAVPICFVFVLCVILKLAKQRKSVKEAEDSQLTVCKIIEKEDRDMSRVVTPANLELQLSSAWDLAGPFRDYRSVNIPLYDSQQNEVLNKSEKHEHFLNQLNSDLEALEPYRYKEAIKFVKDDVAHGSYASISLAQGPEESTKLAVKHYTKSWNDMNARDQRSLVDEIKIAVSLNHKNVVRCFGYILEPEIMVVNEYCKYGSCIDAREKGVTKSLTKEKRMNILITACNGLRYLITKGFLHLDIAARNILLDEYLDAKITDFGRSHKMDSDGFYITDDPIQPLKWTAPEIVLEMKCSEKSEVWAFGVAMWEILTDTEPFPELTPTEACKQVLFENTRLPLSSIKNIKLQEILASCWCRKAQLRPSMKQIGIRLRAIISDGSGAPSCECRREFPCTNSDSDSSIITLERLHSPIAKQNIF